MTQRIKVTVRFDGTGFAGWQVQPNERTVQGELEHALATIAGQPVRVHGASRTDAGVHALGQVFHCDWSGPKGLPELRRSLSQMLSPDIRVDAIEEAAPDFHARYDATDKRYAYVCCMDSEPDPFSARYAWRLPSPVDPERVAELAQQLTGTHDFAGFCSSGSAVATTERTIYAIALHRAPIVGPPESATHWRLEFHGDGFLYKMVRNIVGTVVQIARGITPDDRIGELLASKGPFEGHTAPGHGLFLVNVAYRGGPPSSASGAAHAAQQQQQ
jgi:tRNA pseudouridine38-40 synthase